MKTTKIWNSGNTKSHRQRDANGNIGRVEKDADRKASTDSSEYTILMVCATGMEMMMYQRFY